MSWRTATSDGNPGTREKLKSVLKREGIVFVEENGEGPGVRLKKQRKGAAIPAEE